MSKYLDILRAGKKDKCAGPATPILPTFLNKSEKSGTYLGYSQEKNTSPHSKTDSENNECAGVGYPILPTFSDKSEKSGSYLALIHEKNTPERAIAYKVTVAGQRMTVIDPGAEPYEKFLTQIHAQFGTGRVESIERLS